MSSWKYIASFLRSSRFRKKVFRYVTPLKVPRSKSAKRVSPHDDSGGIGDQDDLCRCQCVSSEVKRQTRKPARDDGSSVRCVSPQRGVNPTKQTRVVLLKFFRAHRSLNPAPQVYISTNGAMRHRPRCPPGTLATSERTPGHSAASTDGG
jgi:hypothetical protein